MQMKNETLDHAYLAGLFDGEGSITISKRSARSKSGRYIPYYVLVVCLVNTHLPTILTFAEMFRSGNRRVYPTTYAKKPRTENGRPCYTWNVASEVAENFLRCVHPYLRIKKEEADLAFEFRDHIRRYKNEHRRFVNSRETWFDTDIYRTIHFRREAMWILMKELKRPDFSGYDGILANSRKAPCPAPMERGRVISSQAEADSLRRV